MSTERRWMCACSIYTDDPGMVVCWKCEKPVEDAVTGAAYDWLLAERYELRAELESLRDFKDLLAFVDDADQPVFRSWEEAHKLHADEPYIGCVFCRDKFVLAEPCPVPDLP